jgi:hypothetical protein
MAEQSMERRLVELFSSKLTCNIVTASFENAVPSRYNVTIIEIGAIFGYTDGTDEVYGPINVNIGSGGTPQLIMSKCTEKCCNRIFGASKVQQAGHEPQIVTGDHRAKDKECLLISRFVLAPRTRVSQESLLEDLKKGTLRPIFELKIG